MSRKDEERVPTLELPVGLGLAREEAEDAGDGWGGLLSFEERRKFFGG